MASGKSLLIKATGTLNEPIEKGAYVLLTVKYGLITILNQSVDLCDQLHEVDLSCPLKKGQMTLTKEVDLPRQIPPVCLSLTSLHSPTKLIDTNVILI